MLRGEHGSFTKSILHVLHYFSVLPLFAARSLWISMTTGVSITEVSQASCNAGFDLLEAAETIQRTVVPPRACGHCESNVGDYQQGEDVVIFGRKGCYKATVFNFVCDICGAVSGPTTTALVNKSGEEVRHVVSKEINKATVFMPQRKPHQRHDEQVGFDRDLLEELTDDAATHKTFESFTLRYNRTMVYAANQKSQETPRKLDIDTFRNAWFLCLAFEVGIALGVPPENTLRLTKKQLGGVGEFERYLEVINTPLGKDFTKKYANHSISACGTEHKAVIGDGHIKTNFTVCCQKNGKLVLIQCPLNPLPLLPFDQ